MRAALEFLKKLTQTDPQIEGLLKQILSDNAMKEMANPTFAALPPRGKARPGQSWSRDTKLDLGPIGQYDETSEYTYKGKEGTLDRIDVKINLKYTPPVANNAANALPFRIITADLKCKDATGYILFNPRKGRIEKSEMNLVLDGKLSIEIGGQITEVLLKQTQKTTVETSDRNPAEPASQRSAYGAGK